MLERQRAVHEVMDPSLPLRAKLHQLWDVGGAWPWSGGSVQAQADPMTQLRLCCLAGDLGGDEEHPRHHDEVQDCEAVGGRQGQWAVRAATV